MPYLQARDGQKLFVRDLGPQSGNKSPVILLHGFGMQSLHWLPFVVPLARNQRFIIPDLRGFGRSHNSSHNQACIMANYADDLADIVAHYGFDTIKLAGISMGAFVALQYQSHYPDANVEHYLHIDQSPKCLNDEHWQWGLFGQEQGERLERARRLITRLQPYIDQQALYQDLPKELKLELWDNLGDFFASALSKPMHKHAAKLLCNQERLMRHLLPVSNWPVYIHCLKAYLEQNYNMLEQIKHLRNRMSLIVGLKSEMYPCGGQLRIADHHPNCNVIPFTKSGHTPLIDQPLLFFRELGRFAGAN